MLTPYHLTCEYFTNPIGLDATRPRLSWKSRSTQRGARQTAYQIIVVENPALFTSQDGNAITADVLWDSGKIVSDTSIHVSYEGLPLRPSQRCYWRVRVWDEDDAPSVWSEDAYWEMGMLENANWQAAWITPDWEEDISRPQPAPLLRRSFVAADDIVAARIYATSLGVYELWLNGQRVGDAVLAPGWTSYDQRLQYQAYDVTALVQTGENVVGAMLGDGWYRGYLGFEQQRNLYGDRLALLLQLHLTYGDGRVEVIRSDANWRASHGPIQMSDLYMGEEYDARAEKAGWDVPGYDDNDWSGVRQLDYPKGIIVAQVAPYVRRQETIRPVRILHAPKGETIFDFGQNMVGWVQLRVRGLKGATVTLRHAEVLDAEGNLYTENLRAAKQITRYTLKGDPAQDEVYEPHFTFQGFQYVAVEGFPGEPTLDSLTGVVLHSEMPRTGSFSCSNPLVNQLQHNILWGQKGNFVDVPTDCPQRDERLGWTGDAQVFIRTACFNMHVAAFFTKWLGDVSADQRPDGSVAFVSPDVIGKNNRGPSFMRGAGSAAWGDAALICPWAVYLCYGDTQLLAEQYASMVGWVTYMRSQADEDLVWRKGFHFGDWLDYRGPGALMPSPVTNKELITTAFFAYGAGLLAQMARILGKTNDAEKYAALADQVKAAFNAEFVSSNGRVGPNTQTAYVLALHFDLLPEEVRPKAAARLATEVRQAHYHLTTGFVGTPYLCHVLSRFGYSDVAYELLNQESYPSWLYPVKKGATTIWERWDGIKPDGSFQDAGMNSFNHYAYGAIGDWLYQVVAGIEVDPAKPGYKHIRFQPQPGGGLTAASATLDSPYGVVASAWELNEKDFRLRISVPPNAYATVVLPSDASAVISEGGVALATGNGILHVQRMENTVMAEVGAGDYDFVTTGLNLELAMASVRHVAGRLDRYTSLRDWLANEKAKGLLVEQLGEEFLQGPGLRWVMDAPLVQLMDFAPHLFTADKLELLEAAAKG